jgi:NADPH2:quinone reductase
VRALTGGKGADVVYDPVGGDAFDQALRAVSWEARMLVIGFAAGRIQAVPANLILVKNISVIGVVWGAQAERDPALINRNPVAYGTSHLALTHRGHLRPGETLLVLGAAGGVGLTAVEIGKAIGARVIAAAGGAEKRKPSTALPVSTISPAASSPGVKGNGGFT